MEYNANNYQPVQGGIGPHPLGMFDFNITATSVVPTQNKDGGMFVVEFTSPAGKIVNRYNMWNKSQVAVDIANKELSALCHATGIFQLSFPSDQNGMPILSQPQGVALIGGVGRMEIGPQMKKDESGKFVETGYVEIKRVFDKYGNEPGRPNSAPQQSPQVNPAPNSAPMTQTPGGGWGNAQQPPNNPAPPAGAPQGWGNANQAPQQPSSPPANNWQPPNGQPQQPQPGNAPNRPAWAG